MRIVELRCQNFARIRAIEIRPSGSLVPITGKNSSGKSSTLRSIWTALVGRAAAPAHPIHDGAEEAVIKLDLGELKVMRRFRRGENGGEITTDLTVTDSDGNRVKRSPQALIDALLGDLTFDPLAFSRMKPQDQYERLKTLVPGVDFDDLARKRQEAYDERTQANRAAKQEQTLADKVALPDGPEPEAIDVNIAFEERNAAARQNNDRMIQGAQVTDLRNRAERHAQSARGLRNQAEQEERKAVQCREDAAEIEANIPAAIDTKVLDERIAGAEKIKEIRALFETRRIAQDRADAARQESERMSALIADLDEQVSAAIAGAKLPAGLTLDPASRTVMLDGFAFADCGTAVKIATSAEVAMALNPKLRVMLIDEGSELDAEHLAALEHVARDRDYQVWVTRVEDGESGTGFRIEDGELAATTLSRADIERRAHPPVTQQHIERAKEKR